MRRLKDLYPEIKENYFLTEEGKVINSKTNRILKTAFDRYGYEVISITKENGGKKNFFIHRALMGLFHPVQNMNSLQVNHIDGNKRNNTLSNLEWVSAKENILHAIENGLSKRDGENSATAKFSIDEIAKILKKLEKSSIKKIATEYNVTEKTISNIKNGISYKKEIEMIKGMSNVQRLSTDENVSGSGGTSEKKKI